VIHHSLIHRSKQAIHHSMLGNLNKSHCGRPITAKAEEMLNNR